MKITKFGHCCLCIEDQGVRLLTDPGGWDSSYLNISGIHAILITHEHPDHLHIDSLKEVMTNNPEAIVITNNGVGKLLNNEGIAWTPLTHGLKTSVGKIIIEAFGEKHADVYDSVEPVDNTGFLIGEKLFHPGDAFTLPGKNVDILALPVAGPWVRLRDSIEYGLRINPRCAFPVHDLMINEVMTNTHHKLPERILRANGISFVIPELGKEFTL